MEGAIAAGANTVGATAGVAGIAAAPVAPVAAAEIGAVTSAEALTPAVVTPEITPVIPNIELPKPSESTAANALANELEAVQISPGNTSHEVIRKIGDMEIPEAKTPNIEAELKDATPLPDTLEDVTDSSHPELPEAEEPEELKIEPEKDESDSSLSTPDTTYAPQQTLRDLQNIRNANAMRLDNRTLAEVNRRVANGEKKNDVIDSMQAEANKKLAGEGYIPSSQPNAESTLPPSTPDNPQSTTSPETQGNTPAPQPEGNFTPATGETVPLNPPTPENNTNQSSTGKANESANSEEEKKNQARLEELRQKVNNDQETAEEYKEYQNLLKTGNKEARKAELKNKKLSGEATPEERAELERLNGKEPNIEEQIKELNAEDQKIAEELLQGKNFEKNMEKLEKNRETRRGLFMQQTEKAAAERRRMKQEKGATQYEKEVAELQGQMREILREILVLPEEVKLLRERKKGFIDEYKKLDRSFKINAENAKTKEAVEHFNKLNQKGAQIAGTNVMIAEAKLGAETKFNEFNHYKNEYDRKVGVKPAIWYIGKKLITAALMKIGSVAIDNQARAEARFSAGII